MLSKDSLDCAELLGTYRGYWSATWWAFPIFHRREHIVKSFHLLIAILCSLQISTLHLSAQIMSGRHNPPYNPRIFCIAAAPSDSTSAHAVLFLGTDGGIFRSDNSGDSWFPIDLGSTLSNDVWSFAIYPRADSTGKYHLFAGTSGGLYYSPDGGVTWTKPKTSLSMAPYVSVCERAASERLLIAGGYGYFFLSTDDGAVWIRADSLLSVRGPRTLLSLPAPDSSGIRYIFAGTNRGILLSKDGGLNWSDASGGVLDNWVLSLMYSDSLIFAGTMGIQTSSDFGRSWKNSSTGIGQHSVPGMARLPDSSGTSRHLLFAATDMYGIYRSSNQGSDWTLILPEFDKEYLASLASTATSSGPLLFAASNTAVYRSRDRGVSWEKLTSGLLMPPISALISAPPVAGKRPATLLAAAAGGNIYSSTRSGDYWIPCGSGIPAKSINCFTFCSASGSAGNPVLFAGTDNGVFQSSDYGITWSSKNTGLGDSSVACLLPVDFDDGATPGTAILFAGTERGGIFRSTDYGGSWITANAGLQDTCVTALALYSPSTTLFAPLLYAGTGNNGIFRSSDYGREWLPVNFGLSRLKVTALCATPHVLYAGTDSGLFRSTDGFAWNEVRTRIAHPRVRAMAATGEELYVVADSANLLYSDREGNNWDMTGSFGATCLLIDGDNVFMGLPDHGIAFASRYWLHTGVEERPGQPENGAFILEQSYPNPVSSVARASGISATVTLPFTLLRPAHVTLTLYNVLGEKVGTPASGDYSSGRYTATWNTAGLPAGIYFYRLETGGQQMTKKMLLVK